MTRLYSLLGVLICVGHLSAADPIVVAKSTSIGGTLEYTWKIRSTVEESTVFSILEIDRLKANDNLTEARESFSYSEKRRVEEQSLTLTVVPASEKTERSVRFKGAAIDGRHTIPDSAEVTVSSSKRTLAKRANHVIDIVISDNGRELLRYVIALRNSTVASHPNLEGEVRELRLLAGKLPVGFTSVHTVKDPMGQFRRFRLDQ
ncbi:MAG: hypothetical protein AAFU85_20540 [Planctomycetota bacterium]